MHTTFENIDELWMSALDDLFLNGNVTTSRVGKTREILGWSATLTHLEYTFLMNKRRALSPVYAGSELLWYLSGDDSIDIIRHYAPQYENFAEDGKAYGAYGHRLKNNVRNFDQVVLAMRLLKQAHDTRQCVVTLWKPDDLLAALDGTHKDLPCTLVWQFFVREDKLHMVVTMRSQDIWLGMPYDIFVNTCMMRLVANELRLKMGTYTHNCGSLHLYEKNEAAAREAFSLGLPYSQPNLWSDKDSIFDSHNALIVESCVRSWKETFHPYQCLHWQYLSDMLKDAVRCCALKYNMSDAFHSPALQEAATHYANNRGK